MTKVTFCLDDDLFIKLQKIQSDKIRELRKSISFSSVLIETLKSSLNQSS